MAHPSITATRGDTKVEANAAEARSIAKQLPIEGRTAFFFNAIVFCSSSPTKYRQQYVEHGRSPTANLSMAHSQFPLA